MKELSKTQKEFLQGLVDAKDYWLHLDDECVEKSCKFCNVKSPTEYRMNGMLHSILTMLDGDSSLNNFKHCDIVVRGKSINKDIELHDKIFEFLYPKK